MLKTLEPEAKTSENGISAVTWQSLEKLARKTRSKSSPRLDKIRITPDVLPLAMELREVWNYRELIYNLVRRDLTTRYRQTVLGVGWAVVQPLFMMFVMLIVFGKLMHAQTGNCPYPVFSFVALLPWQYFSSAVSRSATCMLAAGGLLKKVYFPRLAVVVASVIPPLVDFAIAFGLLIVLMLFYGMTPSWRVVCLPAFIFLAVANAFGVGLWIAALHVKYRDIQHLVPFVLQLMLFVSPVAYSSHAVPANLLPYYELSPMVGIIEGFRWSLAGADNLSVGACLSSFVVAAFLIGTGLMYFRKSEGSFADYL